MDSKQFNFLKLALFNKTENIREILENATLEDKEELLSCFDLNGKTALLLAAKYGGPELIGILLEQGADPHVQDNELENLLHHAVRQENAIELCTAIFNQVNCEPLLTQPSNLADTVFDIALSSYGRNNLLKLFIQKAQTLPTLESFALSAQKIPYHRSADIPFLIQDKIKALQEKEMLETMIHTSSFLLKTESSKNSFKI